MDKAAHVEIRKVRKLVRVLGDSWDRLSTVADAEIETIQTLITTGVKIMPCSFLREGQRVRVTRGPLAGIEGVHVKTDSAKGLLVLSVDLISQSVAVIVAGTDVVPA
jgi:transcription antitermination factor NusG